MVCSDRLNKLQLVDFIIPGINVYLIYQVYIIVAFACQPNSLEVLFTLSGLLGKPWSQVSTRLPPGTCFLSLVGFSIPTARRFSSSIAISRSRAFRYQYSWSLFYARKRVPRTSRLSVKLESTKLIFVGTRTTYQATGDGGYMVYLVYHIYIDD